MAVLLEQFGQVKSTKGLHGGIGLGDGSVHHGRPELIALRVAQPAFGGHFVVVLINVIQPLLPMRQSLASLIDHHCCGAGQVIEQRRRLLPGQTHQTPHTLGCAALKKFLQGLFAEQAIKPFRHGFPQLVGNQGTEPGGRETQLINRIQRPLRGWIKLTQFVEFFPEEFKTDREFTAHREDIDDVPTTAPGSLLIDGGDPLIAKLGQGFSQILEIDLIPSSQGAAGAGERLRRGEMGLQRAFGGHDGEVGAIGGSDQVTENLQLAPDDFAGGIERFVRGPFAGGVKAGAAPAHQFKQCCPTAGLLQGGDNHQQGAALSLRHGTGDQGPTSTVGTPHQQPLGAITTLQQFSGERCLLQLTHHGAEGHRERTEQLTILASSRWPLWCGCHHGI